MQKEIILTIRITVQEKQTHQCIFVVHVINAMLVIFTGKYKPTKEEILTQVSVTFAHEESEVMYFRQEHCGCHTVSFLAYHISGCLMSVCPITGNVKSDYNVQEVFARFFA